MITNNLQAIAELADLQNVSLFVAGGYTRAGFGALHGEPTIEFLKQFRADVCFITADGVDSGGVYEPSLQSSWVSRQMLANSDCRVLVCDSSKFGRSAKFRECDFSELDCIITDSVPSDDIASAIFIGRCGTAYRTVRLIFAYCFCSCGCFCKRYRTLRNSSCRNADAAFKLFHKMHGVIVPAGTGYDIQL